MDIFEKRILDISGSICKNIDKFDKKERGLLSQNILDKLRNLVESISLKIYSLHFNDAKDDYESKVKANSFVASRGELAFLSRFHKFLQASVSHDTFDEEGSVRLMLKYYDYLIELKLYCKNNLSLEILENIDEYPLNLDNQTSEYYQKIAEELNKIPIRQSTSGFENKYYIQKIKPFYVDKHVYYELTLSPPSDYTSKFDRFIAFSKIKMLPNYAVKLSFKDSKIEIINREVPIKIVDNYMVSIRNCEFKNLGYILDVNYKNYTDSKEYFEFMKFLTTEKLNLVEIVELNDFYYLQLKDRIISVSNVRVPHIFKLLDKCRHLIKNNLAGSNMIKHLLYSMTNKIIKAQFGITQCPLLSHLYLDWGCIPFDKMPFVFSPKEHPAKVSDLLEYISPNNREHEFLALKLIYNAEKNGRIYTDISELAGFKNVEYLVNKYNSRLYKKHKPKREIAIDGKNVYIREYELNSLNIIQKLLEFTNEGVKEYKNSVGFWLQQPDCPVDSEEKASIIKSMFEYSRVSVVYGSAGTGKTTLISNISNYFSEQDKLYVTNTHPAMENLKRRVKSPNCKFLTVRKLLNSSIGKCDILILDECSTISNSDMVDILDQISCKLIILVGDIYQIQSIQFGNWFNIAKYALPQNTIFELAETRRTKNEDLLGLWSRVRKIDPKLTEYITRKQYYAKLDNSLFTRFDKDEIILCLNYDGLYGINNINRLIQNENKNKAYSWGLWQYKVGDPIVFNESDRFSPLLYNNLKGTIKNIELFSDRIMFDIEIEESLNGMDVENYDMELLGTSENGKSTIRFYTYKTKNEDEDEEGNNTIIPFQIAYAVSIHKAQGLEYESVKVILTNEIDELITHNIFYTAITRSKSKLKIYWSEETQTKIISNLQHIFNKKDAYILAKKYNLQLSKLID